MSFCVLDDFFRFSKKKGFLGILGPSYCGIGATIRIGREMLCLPYAGFFFKVFLWTDHIGGVSDQSGRALRTRRYSGLDLGSIQNKEVFRIKLGEP